MIVQLTWLLSSYLASGQASAHPVAAPYAPPTLATAWRLEPFATAMMLLAVLWWGIGLYRLWRHGVGRGVPVGGAASFAAGWLVMAVAMIWPLDAFGDWLLSAHMAQHMLLLGLAPPLLLLGLPGPVCLAAMPPFWARRLTRALRRTGSVQAWRGLSSPGRATAIQVVVMWGWHYPAAMDLALRNELVHYFMHGSFLMAGLLFWTALRRSLHEAAPGAGAGALAITGTMVHMGLLGALLTFAEAPLYAHYLERAPRMGLSALEDQQLAGLIMWVPSALPYLIGGLALAGLWLRRPAVRGATGRVSTGSRH